MPSPSHVAGGKRAAATLKAKDPNFYRKLGHLGGIVKNPNKGFGNKALPKSELSEYGRRGGIARTGKVYGPRGGIDNPQRKYNREYARKRRARLRAQQLA